MLYTFVISIINNVYIWRRHKSVVYQVGSNSISAIAIFLSRGVFGYKQHISGYCGKPWGGLDRLSPSLIYYYNR